MDSKEGPVINLTPSTSLKGKVTYIQDSTKPVYTYQGVPFAEPPVGDLRLKKPVPKKLWEGQRDATQYGPDPWQGEPLGPFLELAEQLGMSIDVNRNEDCLYLDIYTPVNTASGSLPVMVWFFGGSFTSGSTKPYRGTAFATLQDVILVSVTYRLGALGFFSTGDEVCPGNFAMWDQIEGLKWVQQHISKFGGDPSNVTIFGESAGSVSINYHHVMPQSRGLFHKAIHISGTGPTMGPLYTPQERQDLCSEYIKSLGLPSDSSPTDLYKAIMSMSAEDVSTKIEVRRPCIDGQLFTEQPYTTYKSGEFARSNSIFTVNSHEGELVYRLLYEPMKLPLKTMSDFQAFLIIMIGFQRNYAIKDKEGFAKALMKEYLPEENPSEDDMVMAIIEICGDIMFLSQVSPFAKLHSGAVEDGTYYGAYGYRHSTSKRRPSVKADHGDDIPIVFGIPLFTAEERLNKEWSELDKNMSKTMIAYFANFAKTGNPNCETLPTWPKFTSKMPQYLNIEKEITPVEGEYKASRANFWANVPQKY